MAVVKKDEPVKALEWNNLRCECGGEIFVSGINLKWKQGSGITTAPTGYVCHACNAFVDSAYLIKLLQYRLKQQEVREAMQDLNEMAPKPEVGASAP